MKLLNDSEYAKSYVRTMAKTTDKGPRFIANSLKEKGAELTFVWVDATPETCHQRMIERNSTRDTWKLTHWDEYIKGVDFSIPTPLASSGCKLIIFDNNLSSDFDKVLANTVKLIEE